MAYIRLTRKEVYDLPAVCMKCGERADDTVTKNFAWAPAWAGMFGAIGQIAMTKRMTVEAPMCDAHQGHWWKRTVVILVGLLAVVLLGGGAVALGVALEEAGGPDWLKGSVVVVMGGGAVVGLIVWCVVALVVQNTSIRPSQITDREIHLTGVCDAFVKAVKKHRQASDDDDDDDDDYDRRLAKRRRR